MKVGYLGPKNSFTFQAANSIVEEEQLVAFASIPLSLQALENNQIDYVVVPIENSLEGSVHASIDRLFNQTDLQVYQEIILPIRQQFLMKEDALPEKILSHPQALAQSQHFLETNYPNVPLEAVASTTFAAEYVANHSGNVAAIASQAAAKEYGLQIIAPDIQDNQLNQTRFWLIGKTQSEPLSLEPPQKVTLFVTLPTNTPGALYKVLAAFAWRNIDLSKIESRPLKTSLGEYFFIIDVTLTDNQTLIQNAIEEISLLNGTVRQIGAYPITIH
uniref:prephenate dehydratase n=1 Tax=Candidatus Enterococcus willemsii TaxID=1857215 RepID=UPI00403F9E47